MVLFTVPRYRSAVEGVMTKQGKKRAKEHFRQAVKTGIADEKVRLFLSSCLTSEAMLFLKEGLVHLTPCKNQILIRKWKKGTIILSLKEQRAQQKVAGLER